MYVHIHNKKNVTLTYMYVCTYTEDINNIKVHIVCFIYVRTYVHKVKVLYTFESNKKLEGKL